MGDDYTLDVRDQAEVARPPVRPDDDHLSWGARIEYPPARLGGALAVRLRFTGRSKPLPVPHPSEG